MTIAEELGKIPNKISVEGHTDSEPFSGRANYTNWELSTDRANASRRLMQQHGLRSDQVAQVRGFADQEPRDKLVPSDPSNRRITLIVKYMEQKDGAGKTSDDPAKELPVLDTLSGKTEKPAAPNQPTKK